MLLKDDIDKELAATVISLVGVLSGYFLFAGKGFLDTEIYMPCTERLYDYIDLP